MEMLDVKFFKPFVDGALQTLKIQCSLEATPGKPFIRGQGPQLAIELAAIIGLTCKAFNGNITLCFPKVVFLEVMGGMLGEKFSEITKDLEDGACELLNIIFGQAKAVLNTQGYNIEKAIPTIARGENLASRALTKNPVFVLPFSTRVGDFHIEIASETSMA